MYEDRTHYENKSRLGNAIFDIFMLAGFDYTQNKYHLTGRRWPKVSQAKKATINY